MKFSFADRRPGRNPIIAVMFAGALLCLVADPRGAPTLLLHAQNRKPGREVTRSIKPAYPAIVKNARIEGTVRLNAIVLANGTVSRVEVIGGNPILADSAVRAVLKWKYVAAAAETSEEVVINFNSKELP